MLSQPIKIRRFCWWENPAGWLVNLQAELVTVASFTAHLIPIKVPTGISVKDRRADTMQIVNAAE